MRGLSLCSVAMSRLLAQLVLRLLQQQIGSHGLHKLGGYGNAVRAQISNHALPLAAGQVCPLVKLLSNLQVFSGKNPGNAPARCRNELVMKGGGGDLSVC